MAGRVVLRHRNLDKATVYVNGTGSFKGSYRDAVHFYELAILKNKGQKELYCVACNMAFPRPLYKIQLTCSVPCKIRHVSALNRKSA